MCYTNKKYLIKIFCVEILKNRDKIKKKNLSGGHMKTFFI